MLVVAFDFVSGGSAANVLMLSFPPADPVPRPPMGGRKENNLRCGPSCQTSILTQTP